MKAVLLAWTALVNSSNDIKVPVELVELPIKEYKAVMAVEPVLELLLDCTSSKMLKVSVVFSEALSKLSNPPSWAVVEEPLEVAKVATESITRVLLLASISITVKAPNAACADGEVVTFCSSNSPKTVIVPFTLLELESNVSNAVTDAFMEAGKEPANCSSALAGLALFSNNDMRLDAMELEMLVVIKVPRAYKVAVALEESLKMAKTGASCAFSAKDMLFKV